MLDIWKTFWDLESQNEPGIKDVQAFVYPNFHLANTLPETNIAPENRPLEKEIPIGNHHFQGLC